MEKNIDIPEGLKRVLNKMCEKVGVDYESIDFTETDWYLKHKWSVNEEKEFKEELIKDIQKNKKLYKGFIDNPISKNRLEKAISSFLLCYGWAYNDVNFTV